MPFVAVNAILVPSGLKAGSDLKKRRVGKSGLTCPVRIHDVDLSVSAAGVASGDEYDLAPVTHMRARRPCRCGRKRLTGAIWVYRENIMVCLADAAPVTVKGNSGSVVVKCRVVCGMAKSLIS